MVGYAHANIGFVGIHIARPGLSGFFNGSELMFHVKHVIVIRINIPS
jgi:hypothetical protein